METLDNILSGKGEATPAPEVTKPETTQAQPDAGAQPDTDVGAPEHEQTQVPLAALKEERAKSKRYTEEVSSFREELGAVRQQNQRLVEMLAQNQQPREQPQAPDWFENPNAAAMHAFGPHLENMQQTLLANAKLIAGTKFGDDKVDVAEKAFVKMYQAQTLDPADYNKVVYSPNRYAAAVQWHQRQLAQAEIGDDPAAFREKVEAEILAKHGLTNGASPAPTPAPAVMPSNFASARNVGARSGPAWGGPAPLNDIFNRKRQPG